MAKQYTKKRSGGKQTSQYRKRKVTKRAPKRASTGSIATPSIKKVIAGEVAKALNSGAQNERRKITMSLAFKGDESQIVYTKSISKKARWDQTVSEEEEY